MADRVIVGHLTPTIRARLRWQAELGLSAVENLDDALALDLARMHLQAILRLLDRLDGDATDDLVAILGVSGIEPRFGRCG